MRPRTNPQIARRNFFLEYLPKMFFKKYSLTHPYGELSITDSSFRPRNAKNHTFPTSIIRTPL